MRVTPLLVLVLAAAGCRSHQKPVSPQIETAATESKPPAAPKGFRVYVSNEASNDITVIDGLSDSVVTRIAIGKRPRALQLSPDGTRLYVAVSGSPRGGPGIDESKLPAPDRSADGIAVLDTASWTLLYTIESGQDPESFDLSRDGKTIFVSNEDAATASVVDVAARKVIAAIKVGAEPEGVKLTPDGRSVYVTSETDNAVFVIDTATRSLVTKIPAESRPRGIAFTPDGSKGFISAENSASVIEVDARTHSPLRTIHIDGDFVRPMGLAVSSDGRTLFVSNGRGGSIAMIDVASGAVTRKAEKIGMRPWGIALSPDGSKLYSANGPSNDVTVVNASNGEVMKRIPAGDSPWGVAIGP